jgi:hypothetical protein
MPLRAPRRGQAIVEATLGILVFISVLLFGLHFAEITFTQMKVTEAAQAAVWDSTSGEMHVLPRIGGNFNGAATNVASARANALNRYTDFDGRTATVTSPNPKGLLSSVEPGSLRINCGVGVGLGQKGAEVLLVLHEAAVYDDNNGMQCNAEAQINPFGTFTGGVGTFLEGPGGFFARGDRPDMAKHKGSATQTAGYKTCAVGRPNGLNGPCDRGQFAMLIDDWGLASGGQESGVCPVMPWGVPCPTNINYWSSAMLMYELNSLAFQTQDKSDHAMVSLVNPPPAWTWVNISYIPILGQGSPSSFYMNFMGQGTLFQGAFWAGDLSSPVWQTTPFLLPAPTYSVAYFMSSGSYLGKPWDTSTIQEP